MLKDIHILIVDEDEYRNASVRQLLNNHNYTVSSTGNRKAAIMSCQTGEIDLIISSVSSSGASRFDFLRSVTDEHTEIGHVVLLDSYDIETVKEAILSGADEYIANSFDNAELLLVLEKVSRYRLGKMAQSSVTLRGK